MHLVERDALRELPCPALGYERRVLRGAKQQQVAEPRRGVDREAQRVALRGELRQGFGQPPDEIDLIGDASRRDDRDEVAVLDHITQFVRAVPRVDRHGDGAAQRDRKEVLDELRAGGEQQPDVLARPHAEGLQYARARHGALRKLAVRDALTGEDQRIRIGVLVGSREQQVADRRHLDPDVTKGLGAGTRRRSTALARRVPRSLATGHPLLARGSVRERIQVLALPGAVDAGDDRGKHFREPG